ncbi:uncharacterized protein BJX67DRAFT_217848 [Aspergillus lucknowensis]|uniref:POP1 C-terminal domain-containing protein n=1 Tax=Aspergillus lucknowensis TaxID=176173 RepID=A0ABR4M3G6_9EURO
MLIISADLDPRVQMKDNLGSSAWCEKTLKSANQPVAIEERSQKKKRKKRKNKKKKSKKAPRNAFSCFFVLLMCVCGKLVACCCVLHMFSEKSSTVCRLRPPQCTRTQKSNSRAIIGLSPLNYQFRCLRHRQLGRETIESIQGRPRSRWLFLHENVTRKDNGPEKMGGGTRQEAFFPESPTESSGREQGNAESCLLDPIFNAAFWLRRFSLISK